MNETQTKIYEWALETSKRYLRAEGDLLDVLQKVEDARVYQAKGYGSLFAFCQHELKLSEAVAYHLIGVARAAKKVPELKSKIKEGKITLTNARRIVPLLNSHPEEWLAKAENYSSRDLEKEIARVRPSAVHPQKIKYINETTVRLEANLPEELALKLREIENFENKDFTELLTTWITEHHQKHSPQEKARRVTVKKGIQTIEKPAVREKRTSIPAAHIHQIQLRDQSQCRAQLPGGKRCENRRFLHIHHKIPIHRGGTHDPKNLILLCSSHHRTLHGGQPIPVWSAGPATGSVPRQTG